MLRPGLLAVLALLALHTGLPLVRVGHAAPSPDANPWPHPRPGQLNPAAAMLPHKTMQIVGGTAADIRDFGHQISWFSDGAHRCGGSIIAPEWVLTAAHCCMGAWNTPQHEVVAGTTLISAKGRARPQAQVVQVQEIVPHPHFDPHTFVNDVALLRLGQPLAFDAVVHAIPIMDPGGPPYANEPVTVTGWGRLKENSAYMPQGLQKVRVFVSDLAVCRAQYQQLAWALPDTLMCASAERKDACQGDSGGPLVYSVPVAPDGDQRDHLVGVVSSGIGCANREYPGLYTDLRHHDTRAFISENTGLRLV